MRSTATSPLRYWLFVYGVTGLGACGLLVHLQQEVMRRTYRVQAAQTACAQLQATVMRMQQELQELQRPEVLNRLARQWGMRPPSPAQLVTLPDDVSS